MGAGALNNVDLREVRPSMIVVAASDRSVHTEPRIALFRLDGATGRLAATPRPLSGTETKQSFLKYALSGRFFTETRHPSVASLAKNRNWNCA